MNDIDPLYKSLFNADHELNHALLIVRESPENYGPFAEPILEHILDYIDSIIKLNTLYNGRS